MEEQVEVTGDFEEALSILIERLQRGSSHIKFAKEALDEFNQRRGNDWYTSTFKRESKNV